MYQEYQLPFKLYIQLKKSLTKDNNNDLYEVNQFMELLPHKLKTETALYIYEDKFSKMKYLKTVKQPSFFSWLCPLLQPKFM